MADGIPRLFTIAPDKPFLEVLADAVLGLGFPCTDETTPGKLDLARWTILLPTRRAVRELEDIFFRKTGGSGVLLPRIRPLGDIDEDLLAPEHGVEELGTPMSVPGQLLLLMDLIDEWAASNQTTRLAQEIAAAPHQAGGLAQSLAELLDAVETEDGRIVAQIRHEGKVDTNGTLQTESADGGKTWTIPRAITFGIPSQLIKLRDGRLLMTYGHRRMPFGNQARVSADHGRTWSEPMTVSGDGAAGDLGYPSTVELADGTLLTVWYENMKDLGKAVLRQAKWKVGK